MKKKILVTGGAGFIGSHVTKKLLALGHEVVVVDNMNKYYDPALKRARLNEFKDKITFYEADIADLPALTEIFEKHNFDTICHLAAQAGVRYSLSHPEVYQRTNVVGTKNVLTLAHTYGIPHVIFASSSSVYGDSRETPFMEEKSLGKPLSPYAATKQEGEKLCREYAGEYGMNITALRFFTVYGPWGRPDMAPIIFTEKMLKGETIELFNGGDMKRDFTYIDDIVDGFMLALEKAPAGFEVFNLGRGVPTPLMDFVSVLETTLAVKARTIKKPMQPGDMQETYASISKAWEVLHFRPKVLIVEGLQKFVEWYRMYYRL
ncbi:MAG: SDR family NAD(P)-dependent oxidoreductase [Patescibacteria group bacterium]